MPAALIINPNTSLSMSAGIQVTAQRVFHPLWTFQVVNAPSGPESLESWRDYQLAGAAVLPVIQEHEGVDGVVLACFGDPGLFALKEISPVPVIGIAEASISLALLLGGKFGILAAMRRAVGLMDSMVQTYGVQARYAGTTPLDMRVLDFEADHAGTLAALEKAGRSLVERGADTMLLGCAGLTSYSAELSERVPLTIIDPVEAGCRMLRTVVEAGLNTSHMGIYSRPVAQRMNNLEHSFSDEMRNYLKTWEAD
jgi:allantoin racemase